MTRRGTVFAVLVLATQACGGGSTPSIDVTEEVAAVDVPGDPGGFDDAEDAVARDAQDTDAAVVDEGLDVPSDLPAEGGDAVVEELPLSDDGIPDLASEPSAELDVPVVEVAADLPEEVIPAVVDPAAVGPYGVANVSVDVRRGNRTTPVVAHVPIGASGRRPLVLFLPGFQLKTDAYKGLADRLASQGIVVVRADPPASVLTVSHVEMAADGVAVLDWALAADGPLAAGVDPAQVGVSGHSLGGKVATMIAAQDARVKALFVIDPVNAGSPITGYSAGLPDIVPDLVAPLAIPFGLVGETTDKEGANFLSPACAPADQNFQTFYDAATVSPWVAEWTIEGADHMDFLDDSDCGFVCSACKAGSVDPVVARLTLWTLEVAFFRLHFGGEGTMADRLLGATLPSGVTVRNR
jgi:pimeloyl-ACP methyl ester carboxylesterase